MRAAEQLMVAQPALSKSIRNLEEELQLTLFDRSDKSISLTPEGRIFLKHARSILEKVDNAKREMDELRGLERGKIHLGMPSMFGSIYFPQIIKEFKKLYPKLHISVVEEGTYQIRKMIENKEVDLGFIMMEQAGPDLDITPLFKEEMVACFPVNHPLSDKPAISLKELVNEPLILFKEGYLQRKLLIEVSRQYLGENQTHPANAEPNITLTSNQLSLIQSCVAEGIGITLFLRDIAQNSPRIKAVPLNPPIFLQLGIASNKTAYLSKAGQTFLSFLKQSVKEKPAK